MNYVDLGDLKGAEKEKWAEAIRDQVGYEFDDLAENSPTMIPDHLFEGYAQELAEDIGAIGKDNQWPLYCIDWKHAAEELQMDYSEVEVDGKTYYFRSY